MIDWGYLWVIIYHESVAKVELMDNATLLKGYIIWRLKASVSDFFLAQLYWNCLSLRIRDLQESSSKGKLRVNSVL